jgi:hypothetical protein
MDDDQDDGSGSGNGSDVFGGESPGMPLDTGSNPGRSLIMTIDQMRVLILSVWHVQGLGCLLRVPNRRLRSHSVARTN